MLNIRQVQTMTGEITLNLSIAEVEKATVNAAQIAKTFEANRQRVYTLAFWMTDNELEAEQVLENTFLRAFAALPTPDADAIDRALLSELRASQPIGIMTLSCAASTEKHAVRRNTKRVDLERAVMQVPATERMIYLLHDAEGYSAAKIARLLGVDESEALGGLHQARLRIREILAKS